MGKTIKAKITWMVILIVIIGLLASNGISFFLASQTIVEGQRESLQVSAEEFAQEIDTWFESERTMTEGVVYNVNLLNTAKPSVKNLTKIVIAHAANRDELLNLYIGTEDKSFAQSNLDAETPEGYDPTERGWYQAAANAGTTIVTDPYMDVLVGGMCITIASPIYYDGNLIGVVGADVTLDTINSIMNSIPEDDGQYGFLVDSSGNYIIHENEEFLPGEDSVVAVADISDSVSEIISEPGSKLVETNDYDGQKNFFATASSEKSGWVLGLAMPSDSIYATSNHMLLVTIIIFILAILAVIFGVLPLIRRSLAPMESMKSFVKNNIIGEENLENTENEVQEINYLIQELKDRFIDTIHRTREESADIQDKMAGTNKKMGDINDNITTISATMEETGAGIDGQTESIRRINEASAEVNETVENQLHQTEQMASKTQEIVQRVEEMVPIMLKNKENAVAVTRESQRKLALAIDDAKVIEQIVDVSNAISNIATQTNLLALNASIEAARAGEAGKGFAVVADEINSLAVTTKEEIDKVNTLTNKVTDSVKALSDESNEILMFLNDVVLIDYESMENLAREYREDAEYYGQMSKTLNDDARGLSVSMGAINEGISDIDRAQEGLSHAMQDVNINLQEITESSESIAKETENVLSGIDSLQETVGKFNV